MSEASTLTNKVIDHIYRSGGYAWRASSVGVFDTAKQTFRTAAKKGVADVLGVLRGRLIAVEIKIGADRLSDEQRGFLANVEHCGGLTMVATDYDSFAAEWEKKVAQK